MKAKVAIITCETYNEEKVKNSLKRGIDLIGGISQFALKGEKILLKPNVLVGEKPEKLVTTHPSVFNGIAEIFNETGADLFYGDSPAMGNMVKSFTQSGFKTTIDTLNIKPADFQLPVKVSFPEALLAKQLYLASGVLEMGGIIGISKMKSHALTRITGAVKNQFGCVPGLRKAEFHVKMPDISDFARMLVDINSYLKSKLRLFIMDGIIAMQGNGPRGGEPFPMNVILLSTDPVALDSVFCRLIDMDPVNVPTNVFGLEAGLGTYKIDEIELVGDDITSLIQKTFDVVRRPPERLASAKRFPIFLKNWISPRPVIDYENCINCGTCIQQCPVKPKAVDWPKGNKKQKPVYNYKQCIRCYCCQETCPAKAINVQTPFLGRLLIRNK